MLGRIESQYSDYKIIRFASGKLHFFLKPGWITVNEKFMREQCEIEVNTRNKDVTPNNGVNFQEFYHCVKAVDNREQYYHVNMLIVY